MNQAIADWLAVDEHRPEAFRLLLDAGLRTMADDGAAYALLGWESPHDELCEIGHELLDAVKADRHE